MTILHRDIQNREGEFVKRVELERVSPTEIRYRRYAPPDLENPVVDRMATEQEAGPLLAREQDERERNVRERAENALSQLEAIRDSTGTPTNDQLASAVRTIARVLAAIVRLLFRKFGP